MIECLDHVAIRIPDLDQGIASLTSSLNMEVIRIGEQVSTGNRIAMLLAPSSDVKLELIEDPSAKVPALQHLAYTVDDVDEEYRRLTSEGCKSIKAPHEISAAKAITALLEDQNALQVQIITYASNSPDVNR